MPTLTPNQQDAITENFEGLGSTTFYYLSTDKSLDFGYGYNLTGNNIAGTAAYWVTALQAVGVPANAISAMQNAIVDLNNGNTSALSTDIAAANSALSALSPAQLSASEVNAIHYYINNADIPDQTAYYSAKGVTFSSLPTNVQVALEDIGYNVPGNIKYIGPNLIAALQNGLLTGDYSQAAYQLAFATAPVGSSTAYAYRATADALTLLGLTYTINGTQNITAVSGAASPSQIIEFMSQGETLANPANFGQTSSGLPKPDTALINALNTYGAPLGFTVNGGVATVTSGNYNTTDVTFNASGTETFSGTYNNVNINPNTNTTVSGLGNTVNVNLTPSQAQASPDATAQSAVTFNGSATISGGQDPNTHDAYITINGPNLVGALFENALIVVTQSGDQFVMANGSSVDTTAGTSVTLTCGITQNGTLNTLTFSGSGPTTTSCTIDPNTNRGTFTTDASHSNITVSGGNASVVDTGDGSTITDNTNTGDNIALGGTDSFVDITSGSITLSTAGLNTTLGGNYDSVTGAAGSMTGNIILGTNNLNTTVYTSGLTFSDASGVSGGTVTLGAQNANLYDYSNGLTFGAGPGVTGGILSIGASNINTTLDSSGLTVTDANGANDGTLFLAGNNLSFTDDATVVGLAIDGGYSGGTVTLGASGANLYDYSNGLTFGAGPGVTGGILSIGASNINTTLDSSGLTVTDVNGANDGTLFLSGNNLSFTDDAGAIGLAIDGGYSGGTVTLGASDANLYDYSNGLSVAAAAGVTGGILSIGASNINTTLDSSGLTVTDVNGAGGGNVILGASGLNVIDDATNNIGINDASGSVAGGDVQLAANNLAVFDYASGSLGFTDGAGVTSGQVIMSASNLSVVLQTDGFTVNDGSGVSGTVVNFGASDLYDTVNSSAAYILTGGYTGESLFLGGSGNAVNLNSSNLTLISSNLNDTLDGNDDWVFANSNTGEALSLDGTHDNAYANDSSLTLSQNAVDTVNGNDNSVATATDDSTGLFGGGNNIHFQGGTVEVGATDGLFDQLYGDGDSNAGTSESGQATGLYVDANSQINLTGSGDFTSLAAGAVGGVYGQDNTISAGPNNLVVVGNTGNTFDNIYASDDQSGATLSDGQGSGIYINSGAFANLNGNGDYLGVSPDGIAGVYGQDNTVQVSNNDLLVIGNTADAFDTIYASNDTGGYTFSDGQGSGIVLDQDSQANVYGYGSTVYMNTGDSAGFFGGGFNITLGSDQLVEVSDTGGVADTINASYDISGDSTANGQGTGVIVLDDSQADLVGNDDYVSAGAYSSLNISGSDESVYVGNDTTIYATGSDDTFSGGYGDTFVITGQYDPVDATSSSIVYDGGDTIGDDVNGSGDTGSGWDDYNGGGGGYGYYGYWGFGFSANPAPSGSNISAIAAFDSQLGNSADAVLAETARLQATDAAATTTAAGLASAVFEGPKWAGGTLSWTLDVASGPGTLFTGTLGAQYETEVQAAFATWAKASGLNIVEVSSSANADIKIGLADFDSVDTGILGLTKLAAQNGQASGAAILLEDPSETALAADGTGQLAYAGTATELEQLLLHEIGHALGLADSTDPNSVMNPVLSDANLTLDATDIQAIQALYGASSSATPSAATISSYWSGLTAQSAQLVQAAAGLTSMASSTAAIVAGGSATPTIAPIHLTSAH